MNRPNTWFALVDSDDNPGYVYEIKRLTPQEAKRQNKFYRGSTWIPIDEEDIEAFLVDIVDNFLE